MQVTLTDAIVALFVGLLVGIAAGICIDRGFMQWQAIKHNAAEYDTKTGQWRWKGSGDE